MAVLHLTEQGGKLKKEGRRLIFEKEHEVLFDIPLANVEKVFVYGNVQITTQTILLLMQEGIPVIFMSASGKVKGYIEGVRSRNVPVRLLQYEKAMNEEFCVKMAKKFVKAKIKNMRRALQRISYNRRIRLDEAIERLEMLSREVESKRTRNSIRGLEGIASAVYFETFGRLLTGGDFVRTRRPPRDPLNALLSYGYSVLLWECVWYLGASGLDPYIGFFHIIRYGRPALALDLMEEFRTPVVEMDVLELVSHRIINLDTDFEREGEGMILKKEARKKFLAQYERRMRGLRKAIHRQCERLVAHLTGREEYQGYCMS